ELHERADAAADRADDRAAGEPDQERAVAVRRALPGPEPDAVEDHPQRVGVAAGMGDVPGCRLRHGTAAVADGGAAVPPREAGDLGLIPHHADNKKPGRWPGFSVAAWPPQPPGLNAIVRRVV